MLFILYSLITYKFTGTIKPNQSTFEFPFQFGFDKNGDYSIEITNGRTENYLLFITREDDIYKIINETEINFACINLSFNNHPNFHVIQIVDGKWNVTGIIKEKGVYKTIIKSCLNYFEGFSIKIIYNNPQSNTSYVCDPLYLTMLLIWLPYFGVIVFWLVNCFHNFSLKNVIHLILSAYSVIVPIDIVISAISFALECDSNDFHLIYKVQPIINFLRNLVFYFASFMVFLGFYLVSIRIPILGIFIGAVSSLLLSFGILFDVLILSYVFFGIGMLSCLLLNKELYRRNVNRLYIIAVALFIANITADILKYSLKNLTAKTILIVILTFLHVAISMFLSKLDKTSMDNYIRFFAKRTDEIIFPDIVTIENKSNFIFGDNMIRIPNNVVQIKNYAFQFISTTIINFDLNSRLLEIGMNAFSFSAISCIKIPPSVVEIEQFAFSNCKRLTKVVFMERSHILVLRNIFDNSSINTLNIPSSLEEIEDDWCSGLFNLNDITLAPNNHHFIHYQNDLILGKSTDKSKNFDKLIFARRNINCVKIPSFVKVINSCAFAYCKLFDKVEFEPDSKLALIDKNAFYQTSITEIVIPSNVVCIDGYAFYQCKKLNKVLFGKKSKLFKIERYAFNDSSIKEIKIPSRVVEIGQNAFQFCYSLKNVDFPDDSDLLMIGSNAFDYTAIESVTITSKVTLIGKDAFSNCQNLRIVEFKKNIRLTSLNKKMFQNSPKIVIMTPPKMIEGFIK